MKRMTVIFGTLAALAAASLLAAPAMAGVELGQVPSRGSIPFVQLPDGTFLPQKGDANGNAGANAIPTGYVQVTVSSTAVGITVPTGATWCVFTVETNAIRWRDDGTNPTAAIGFPQASGSSWVYPGSLSAIKFIRQSADATLNGACYK